MKKDITFLINRSEIAAGTRGASLGPGAIMTAARNDGKRLFGEFPIQEVKDMNHLLDQPVVHAFAKRVEGLVKVYKSVTDNIKKIVAEDRFPLVISGDHGSAGGTIAGLKAAHPDKRIGVIWIDAHGDIHTPYTTPSGNMHGMPLATAIFEDNLECKINEVPQETIDLWNVLKNTGVKGRKISPEDLVFIGVRDIEKEEIAIINRLNIKNYEVDEVTLNGEEIIVDEIDAKLAACDLIYVSFDVDSMDPQATSHGTGTPVDKGLQPQQAGKLLTLLAAHPKTCCIEFVEVNPCLDEQTNKMAEVAYQLLEEVVNVLKKN